MSKPKIQWIVTGIVITVLLLGTGRAVHIGPRLRLGYRADSILGGATRVETFRVMSSLEAADAKPQPRKFGPKAPQIDGCYITATAKEQGPVLVQKIVAILFDEGTYTNERAACITFPGVVFRVWNGSQSVDVIICFQCGEMFTVTHGANGESLFGVYTLMAGNSRSEFVCLAKEAFPHDAEIQAL